MATPIPEPLEPLEHANAPGERLPGRLGTWFAASASGELGLDQGGERVGFTFRCGTIVAAHDSRLTLADTLARHALVSRGDATQAAATAARSGRPIEETLASAAHLLESTIEAGRALHLADVLRRALGWRAARCFGRRQRTPTGTPSPAPLPLSSRDVVAETIRSLEDRGMVRWLLADRSRFVCPNEPAQAGEPVALTERERELLAAASASPTARALIGSAPADGRAEAERALLLLVSTGCVSLDAEPAATARDADAWYTLALAHKDRGEVRRTVAALRRALSIDPGHLPSLKELRFLPFSEPLSPARRRLSIAHRVG
jgi:hypothetical protein